MFPEATETAVSKLEAVVRPRVLVSVHERTPLNIQRLSQFFKMAFFNEALEIPLKFQCFQLMVTSARNSSSADCIVRQNNTVEHHI